MPLYLVRHAKAIRRAAWRERDELRPLTAGGHRQALRLVQLLRGEPVARILAAPSLRCRQTVEPLAAQRGLPLETTPALAEGADVGAVLRLLGGDAGERVVLSAHGDLIARLLLCLCDARRRRDDRRICEKGSIWIVDRSTRRAVYRAAPTRSAGSRPPSELPSAEPPAAPGTGDAKLRVAVLDLGSTSFHLLVADASPLGAITRVMRERQMLRLGSVVANDRHIPDDVCARAVATARALRRAAENAGAERLRPVATAALREARNGAELARRIGLALGEPVRILSGAEEARLMFAAFRHRVPLGGGSALGLDLGGGSLELAVGDDTEVHWEHTMPLGIARLHGEIVRSDPLAPAEVEALRGRVRELVTPHRRDVVRDGLRVCVATGGTVAALARRVATRRTSWPRRAVSQLFVPRDELGEVSAELVASRRAERLRTPGIQRQRADLLPAGAVVLEEVAASLDLEGFTVSDWGLREGAVLEELGLVRSGRRLLRPASGPTARRGRRARRRAEA